jgi:hypothetical protein
MLELFDGARSLRPLLGGAMGFLAWVELLPHSSPNHPPHVSLSREAILAYAGFVVDGAVLSSPFTGVEYWAFWPGRSCCWGCYT